MISTQTAEEYALRQCLKGIVADRLERRSGIAGIERKRHDHSSSYASDIVTVRLVDGEALRFFLKAFGASQFHKSEPEQQRDRELRVYRDLLAEANLGTARYYGSVWEEPQGWFWLLLEFVDGTPVRYCDFAYWVAAARWLGRMHGYFAPQAAHPPAGTRGGCDFLLHHDAEFFWSQARLAMAAVSQICPKLSGRLGKILDRYEPLVAVMASQPPTLVHGSYKPRHILLDLASRPPRLCPVDWELAAIGSALYDVAFLAYGFEAPSVDEILDAYRREAMAAPASGYPVPVPDREEMRYVVDCFHLHRIMKALSGAQERKLPESSAARYVKAAERLSERVS